MYMGKDCKQNLEDIINKYNIQINNFVLHDHYKAFSAITQSKYLKPKYFDDLVIVFFYALINSICQLTQ